MARGQRSPRDEASRPEGSLGLLSVAAVKSSSTPGRRPSPPGTPSGKTWTVPKKGLSSIAFAERIRSVDSGPSAHPDAAPPHNDPTDTAIRFLVVVQQPVRPEIRIAGEGFFVETDGPTVYLRHPRWSLLGAGRSLFEAERDLRSEAAELAH